MKLFRFGPKGAERPGVVREDGAHLDLSPFGEDFGERFFENDGLRRLAEFTAREGSALREIPEGSRLGPCITRPCISFVKVLRMARGAKLGSLPWVALLSAACATLPSTVPLADSSGGVLAVSPGRDRRPRSDAGAATVSVETADPDGEVEVEAEPEEVTEEVTVVASADAGAGCDADAGAVTWPGEYYGSDRLTTTFEEMPPHTMTDDKAHTRVELGKGDRIVISIVDSSKGDVMCALNATVDGADATLELGQTCFGQGESAPDIMSGTARLECDRLTLDLTAATEIELEDDVRAGEMVYHFEGKRR